MKRAASMVLVTVALTLFACGKDAAGPTAARSSVADGTPEGTLGLFLAACVRAGSDDEAERAAALAEIRSLAKPLVDDAEWTKRHSNRTFVERLTGQPWIFRSYHPAATPANGYVIDGAGPLVPEITERREVAGGVKLWVRSSGADSPRPVFLVKPEGSGIWYVQEWSSLYVEVRKPKS